MDMQKYYNSIECIAFKPTPFPKSMARLFERVMLYILKSIDEGRLF